MNPATFKVYREYLYKVSGYVLGDGKDYLLNTRLQPVIDRHNIASLDALAAILVKPGVPPALAQDVTDAMTINETSFFRDTRPFDMFRNVILPDMLKKKAATRRLRIWCAASSSGQEPYSLAMILKEEAAKMPGWQFDILGTDISRAILKHAQAATYSQFEVQRGMPIQLLMKYFTKTESNHWQLKPEITGMVKFQPLNLLESFRMLGKFDVVFCRNVLIYFDEKTKSDILGRVSEQMDPEGYMLLGGAETILGLTSRFQSIPDQRGLYRPVSGTPAATATVSGTHFPIGSGKA